MRHVRGAVLVAIGIVLGAAGGVVIGVQWASELRAQWFRAERTPHEPFDLRNRDPKQWRQDSAAMAKIEANLAVSRRPREVRRVQALNTCAITLEIRDTLWKHLGLFHLGAWDRAQPGVTIAEGWAYRDGGFGLGDSVTAVLPNVYCGDIDISGWSASYVRAAAPRRLDVR